MQHKLNEDGMSLLAFENPESDELLEVCANCGYEELYSHCGDRYCGGCSKEDPPVGYIHESESDK